MISVSPFMGIPQVAFLRKYVRMQFPGIRKHVPVNFSKRPQAVLPWRAGKTLDAGLYAECFRVIRTSMPRSLCHIRLLWVALFVWISQLAFGLDPEPSSPVPAPPESFKEIPVGPQGEYTAFGIYNACPESPDGKRIIFIRFKTSPLGGPRNAPVELWICNRDLTGYRKIKDLEANADNHNGAFVQWVDNDSIAYSGNQSGNGDVYVVNADTGETEFGPYKGACVGDNTFGTQFLMAVRSRKSNVGPQGLYWVDGATGEVQLIFRNTDFASYAEKFKATNGPEEWYPTHPHLSTDGSHIFFKMATPREQFLFICRVDGSELVYWGPGKPMHTHFYDEETIWGADNNVPDRTPNNMHFKRWRSDKTYLGTLAGVGCHTAMSPDKKWFLGESWYNSNPIVLRLYAAGETTARAELFSCPFTEMVWEYRGHVNPSFSRDGKRAYYNRAVSNSLKQATMVDISRIVEADAPTPAVDAP